MKVTPGVKRNPAELFQGRHWRAGETGSAQERPKTLPRVPYTRPKGTKIAKQYVRKGFGCITGSIWERKSLFFVILTGVRENHILRTKIACKNISGPNSSRFGANLMPQKRPKSGQEHPKSGEECHKSVHKCSKSGQEPPSRATKRAPRAVRVAGSAKRRPESGHEPPQDRPKAP